MLSNFLEKVSRVNNCLPFGAVLLLFALAGCAGDAQALGDSPKAEGCHLSMDLEDLATEFRSLRMIKGHFEGGPRNADVDQWMGRKHQIMIQLGSLLGSGGCGKVQINRLLGPPDLTAREGDVPFHLVNTSPKFKKPASGQYELLIYYWRGTHDFLYLTSQGETILNSGWWHAGE